MTPDDFVDALRAAVMRPASEGTIQSVKSPPGRTPPPILVSLAEWWAQLTHDDRHRVTEVVTESARAAVFGFCAVLDGSRAVGGAGPKGTFRLVYVAPDGSERTISPTDGDLHDLWNGTAPPWGTDA